MKLIDKDDVVAEIENLLDKGRYHEEYDCAYRDGNNGALYALKDKLDTIEVKEVDLEKAIDDYIYTHNGRKRMALELDWEYCNLTLKGGNEIIKFAKHFFELGMQASNPLTWEDIANINDIVSEILKECKDIILYDTQESFCKEVLKRFKAQKGEKVWLE